MSFAFLRRSWEGPHGSSFHRNMNVNLTNARGLSTSVHPYTSARLMYPVHKEKLMTHDSLAIRSTMWWYWYSLLAVIWVWPLVFSLIRVDITDRVVICLFHSMAHTHMTQPCANVVNTSWHRILPVLVSVLIYLHCAMHGDGMTKT